MWYFLVIIISAWSTLAYADDVRRDEVDSGITACVTDAQKREVLLAYTEQLDTLRLEDCSERRYALDSDVTGFISQLALELLEKSISEACINMQRRLFQLMDQKRNAAVAAGGYRPQCSPSASCRVVAVPRLIVRSFPHPENKPSTEIELTKRDRFATGEEVLRLHSFRSWSFVEGKGVSNERRYGWSSNAFLVCKR